MHYLDSKIPPVLIGLASVLVIWALSTFVPAIDLGLPAKIAISAIGVLAAAICGLGGVISFGRAGTTVNPHRPREASTLVTTGVYRMTRNPMYLGIALILTSISVWIAFPWSLASVAGFILYIDRFQIRPEERALMELFGDEYRRYCGRVRRWL